MHFQSSRSPRLRSLRSLVVGHFPPVRASEDHYSDSDGYFLRIRQPVQAALPGFIGGRSPPGRRSRYELQALSNSLQLT